MQPRRSIEATPPLLHKTLVVTRPKHQSAGFAEKIKALGGVPLLIPAIKLTAPIDKSSLCETLTKRYDWIVFTSVNGVESVAKILTEEGLSKTPLLQSKLAAIGPATGDALKKHFRTPDIIPNSYISDEIPEHLGDVVGAKILLPRADIARVDLSVTLKKRGADVTNVAAYQITENCDEQTVASVRELDKPDYLTFTSSSTVRGLATLLQKAGRSDWFTDCLIACIGPITAQTVKELGFRADIVAKDFTTDGLLEAIINP